MNWDDVQQVARNRFDAGAKTFDLEATDFVSASMHALFSQTLKTQSLRLTAVSGLQTNGGTIVAQGMIQGAPRLTQQQVPAIAILSFAQNEPQLVLACGVPTSPPAPSWTFGSYFPQLRNTALQDLQGARNPAPWFIYSSYDHTEPSVDDGAPPVALKSGLNFHGGVVPGGVAFKLLSDIAGELADTAMTGPIRLYDYGPIFDLTLDKQASLSRLFEKLHLPLSMSLTCNFSPDGRYYRAGLSISTHVDLGQTRGLTLDTLLMAGARQWVTLSGTFQNVALPGPGDIVDLVGGDGSDFDKLLPSELRSGGGIYLDSMWISIAPAGPRVACVGFGLGTAPDKSWTIIPDWFTLKSITGRLNVYDPFGAARSAQLVLTGTIDVPSRDPALQVEAGISFPRPMLYGRLVEGTTFDLPKLIGKFVPGVADVLPLTFDTLELAIDLAQKPASYRFTANSSESKTWQFGGQESVHFTAINLDLSNGGPGGAVAGMVGGSVSLFGYQSNGVYNIGKGFALNAQIPDFKVDLQDFAERLVGTSLGLPDWLPSISFMHTEISISHSSTDAASDVLALRTGISTGGAPLLLAFEALKVGGQWGFVVGIDASVGKLSSLPGLSGLSVIDDVVRLDEIIAIISSATLSSYSFPMGSRFNDPTLKSTQLRLPGQAGQINPGLYVYSRWTIDTTDKKQNLLHTLLKLQGSIGMTLQIGKSPTQDAKLYLSYSGSISGLPLSAQVGVAMSQGQAGFYLQGNLQATIQKRECDFQVEMMFVAAGAFISGSMVGSITFEGLTLSNLALVIGTNWEGVPSLGVACSLTVQSFSSSLAVFFDSTQPSRSMLAGAVSDLKLKDVVETLSQSRVPPELGNVLSQVALLHTKEFTIDGALSDDLDNLKLDRLAAAFNANGVPLSTSARDVLVVAGKQGETWFLTNMRDNMMHYELMKSGNTIKVMLNPQFYCIPQATALGALKFEQGFFLTARLKVIVMDASATVLVKPTKGILIDGEMNRIVVWKEQLFSATSADGKRGARLSVATFTQPEVKDPALRGPHFLIDGQISLLGLSRRAFVTVSEKGFRFDISGDIMPAFNVELKGQFSNLNDFSAGGGMKIGVGNVDLGPLGKANIATGANASLDSGFDGRAVKAKVAGGFQFAGQGLSIPAFDLDLNEGLLHLPKRIADEVIAALKRFLTDAGRWAELIGRGALTGIVDMANTLKNTFKVPADEAAKLMKTARQTADAVANGLRSAYGASADQVAHMLKGAGFAANEVAGALKSAFNTTADQAAKILKGAGFAANEVGNALRSAYGATAEQVASLLRGAGYTANEVAGALRFAFNVSVDQAAQLLRQAGYAANEVGNALKSAFNATADVAAKALKGAGYAVNEVGNVLTSAYGVASDQANKILQGAGYAANEVNKFFGKAGDAVVDTAKKAGDALNPTKW